MFKCKYCKEQSAYIQEEEHTKFVYCATCQSKDLLKTYNIKIDKQE